MDEFELLVRQAPDGVVILEAGRIVFMNATAGRLLGVEPEAALGTPIAAYLPPEDAALTAERIRHMMMTGEANPAYEYGTLADPERTVEIKAMPWLWQGRRAVLAFARDATERKALQQQLAHAARLASIGTLAAGVAHEINNPLQYMQLSVSELGALMRDPQAAPERAHSLVAHLEHGIDRIANITRSLRVFARPRPTPPEPTDAAAALAQALAMVGNDLRHRAKLVKQIGDVPAVVANAPQLEQVLVNLLVNAMHSLTGKPDDAITVAIAEAGSDHVAIEIADTGAGMSREVLARVFDPFFTTKPIGSGMGLGLSVSKGLIDAVGGALELDSKLGVGTTARVILRVQRRGTATGPVPRAPTPTPMPIVRRRVLVLDDEARVRETLGDMLRDVHDVELVGDGESALRAVRAGAFEAILCDVMMAGMNGSDVYRRIAVEHPGLERRIVFITGGAFVAEVADLVARTGNLVLEKPVNTAELLDAIEHASSVE